MDENILEILTEHTVNEKLDDIILGDENYKAIQEEVDENQGKLDGLNLSQEQKMLVDDLTASYIAKGICYARVAYRQGFKDCAALFREIGAI